jgi:hypothetical protein
MNIIIEVFSSQQHVRMWLDLINKSLIAYHRENEYMHFVSDYYYTVFETAPASDYTGIVGATNAGAPVVRNRSRSAGAS